MALPSGLAAQFGMAFESTYGTFVTPTAFTPLVSETVDADVDRMESEGIIAGRHTLTSEQWEPGAVSVAGDLGFELYDRGIGKLFKAMFGGVATSGSGPYTHTFTPGALTSFTAQIGKPATDGTVHPANLTGLLVGSWELAAKAGEIGTLGLSVVGQNSLTGSRVVTDGVTTNASTTATSATAAFTQADVGKVISGTGIPSNTTIAAVASATSITLSAAASATGTSVSFTIGAPLASASYSSGQLPVSFKRAALTIGGVDQEATEITVKGDNGLSDRRPKLGSVLTRQHLPSDLKAYTADIKAEFDSLTSYNAFRAGTEAALSLAFTIGTYSLTISGNVRYDGAKTNVAGRGILEKDIMVKFVGTAGGGADSTAITAVLVNGDSTV